jgi:hypothetical protein
MDWSTKAAQRFETVIEIYRRITGRRSIPYNRQYWTLCGLYDSLKEGMELVQVVNEGFAKPIQFYATEAIKDVCRESSRVIGRQYPEAHIFEGDLVRVMDEHLTKKKLNPEVVYVDTISEPRKAIALLADVIGIVNYTSGFTMVVCNMIRENPRRGFEAQRKVAEVFKVVEENQTLAWHKRQGVWSFYPDLADYRASRARMSSLILVRKGEALRCSA